MLSKIMRTIIIDCEVKLLALLELQRHWLGRKESLKRSRQYRVCLRVYLGDKNLIQLCLITSLSYVGLVECQNVNNLHYHDECRFFIKTNENMQRMSLFVPSETELVYACSTKYFRSQWLYGCARNCMVDKTLKP